MSTLHELQTSLIEAQKQINDIKVSDDQPADPPEIVQVKQKIASETGRILAPVIFNFVERRLGSNLIQNSKPLQTSQPIGADRNASYLLLSSTSSLASSRVLVAGTGVSFTDTGEGESLTIATSLLAGPNITINQVGNSWAITGSAGGGGGSGDTAATYLVVSNTSSLSSERAITAGKGIGFVDGGANSTFTISASLLAGPNITIAQVGNSLAISGTTGADAGAAYIVVSTTASLANERALAAGGGIAITDGGANSNITVATNLASSSVGFGTTSNVLSGNLNFRYDNNKNRLFLSSSINGSGVLYIGVSESLYLTSSVYGAAGQGILTNHGTMIGGVAQGTTTVANILSWGYLNGNPASTVDCITIGDAGWTSMIRFQVGGTTVDISDATIDFNVAQVGIAANSSLSALGNSYFYSGLSGSHQRLTDGTPAFVAGPNITITTQSNGAIAVSGSSWATTGSIFTISGTYAYTTSSLSIGTATYNANKAAYTFLFVSGAVNSLGTNTRGVSVFGGDILTSGTVLGMNSIVAIPSGSTLGGITSSLASNLVAFGAQYQTAFAARNQADSAWLSSFLYMDGPSKDYLAAGDVLGALFGGNANNRGILFYNSASVGTTAAAGRLDRNLGNFFSGSTIFPDGLSGSLQRLKDGTPAFVAGSPNVSILTQSNGAVAISASAWQTLYEVDFTAQGTQAMGSNGFYTIDGKTWRLENATNALSATLVNGTGLVLQVNSNASDYTNATRTGPIFSMGISQLTSSLDLNFYETRVLCFMTATNVTTNFEAFQMVMENTQSLKDGTRNSFGIARGFSTTTYWAPGYTEEGTAYFLEKGITYYDNHNTMILWMQGERTVQCYIASGTQVYQSWPTEDTWIHAGTIQTNRPMSGIRVMPPNLANSSGSNVGFTVYTGAVASQDIRAVVKFLKVEYRRT